MYEDLYVSLLEQEPVGRTGDEIRFHCPSCGSIHDKLYVNINNGMFDCKNEPDFHGGIYTFLHTIFKMSFPEIKEYLNDWDIDFQGVSDLINPEDSLYDKLVVIKHQDDLKEDEEQVDLVMPPLPSNFKLIMDNLANPESFPFANYLNRRGVTYDQLVKHSIGYVTQGEIKREEDKVVPVDSQVIFITKDINNNPIYWNSRSILPNPYIKSLNGVGVADNNYTRKDVIFNLNNFKDNQAIVICEGVFNALTIDDDQYLGVATFGKAITDIQVNLLANLKDRVSNYYLFLDTDAKGTMFKLASRMVEQGVEGNQIKMVINPYEGQDVNDLGKELAHVLLQRATIPFDFKGKLKYMNYMKV